MSFSLCLWFVVSLGAPVFTLTFSLDPAFILLWGQKAKPRLQSSLANILWWIVCWNCVCKSLALCLWNFEMKIKLDLPWKSIVERKEETAAPYESVFFFLKVSGCFSVYWSPSVLLPGNSHGRRSLVGGSPWGGEESGMTEQLHFHFSLSCIGEGGGSPLQCSCLENPRDRGAWWAAVYGVAQSWTRLKWFSSSSSPNSDI